MKKIIIFGASKLGEIAYNILKEEYIICAFADNDSKKWGEYFCSKEILQPEKIINCKFDKMIIASMYYVEISLQLRQYGIENMEVFTYSSVDDKTYNKRYCLDEISDLKKYTNIKVSNDFKNRFVKNFSLLYDKSMTQQKEISNCEIYNKNILIVAFIFPPMGGSGVQRTLKFVKYLKEYGYNPIVVTVGKNFFGEEVDKTLIDEIPKELEVIRISHRKFNTEQLDRKNIEEVINLLYGISNDEKLFLNYVKEVEKDRMKIMMPDNTITWVNEVLRNIENLVNFNDFKYIYTTSSPYSSHIIGYYIKKKYNKLWIADFRDEWSNNPYNTKERLNNTIKYRLEFNIERSILNSADKVIYVTSISTESCKEIFNLEDSKVKTITNGYDEEDFKDIILNNRKNNKFLIVFSGTMYENMFPKNFIKAFNELICEGLIDKELIEINFYGRFNVSIPLKINKLDEFDLIKCYGYLSHHECLMKNSISNILFLPVGEGDEFRTVYTGKVFEYIRLQIPILALAPKDGVLADLLNKTNTGLAIEYSDIKSIKAFILEKYTQWRKDERFSNCNLNEIMKYDRKTLTKDLINIFEELDLKY